MKLVNKWINGDCLKELAKMKSETVDLIITSLLYHNLRVYSNDPCDISNCERKVSRSLNSSNKSKSIEKLFILQ